MLSLQTSIVGRKVIYLREVESTNDLAKLLALHEDEGTVIVADRQTRGRGRIGRRWESPEGGVWMSVILRPPLVLEDLPKVVFMGAVAVVETLEKFGIPGKVKWPNDVLVEGRKIAGILAEGKAGTVVLGIGLNVNNPVPEGAISMKDVLGSNVPLVDVFRTLIARLDEAYSLLKERPASIVEKAKSRMILGVPVIVVGEDIEGIAEDIDEFGRLIVRKPSGEVVKVVYGDLSIRFAQR
ncbi:biotin--[acetyl-CoA-carboxylase] ligase [Pyrococcus yayanosii]|nr:biotin--[acetyl-CoA-carboxylase] ligase [Pyrococcus yayanosii]